MIQIKCCLADSVFTSFCFSPLQVGNMKRRKMMQCLCISPNFFFIFLLLQIFGSKSYFSQQLYFVFDYNPSQSQAGHWAIEHIWSTSEISNQSIHLNWLVNFCTRNIEHQASSYRIVIVLQWWTGGWYWLVGSQWDTTQPSIHHSMASSNPT